MSQLDWFASFADMCGVQIPVGAAPDSENHFLSWCDATAKGRMFFVGQNVQNNLSITDGEWKYIPAATGPAINQLTNTELGNNSQEGQLYNLVIDPGESKNIIFENKKRAQIMHSELLNIIERGEHYKTLKE